MEFHGVVDHWNEDRGFGFVKLGDGRRIFCHITALRHAGLDKLRAGERVELDIETAPDGRPRVRKIALVEAAAGTIPALTGGATGEARETADAIWVHDGRD